MSLSSGDGYLGELLELPQGCQGPIRGSREKVGFLSQHLRGKGPHLLLKGESPGFSRVVAANTASLSYYNGNITDPLVGAQECPVSMRVARGLSGFLSSWCRDLGPHLELWPEPQCSSPVLLWILGFLWSFNRGVRPRLMWRHASPLSSRGVKGVSGFLSC